MSASTQAQVAALFLEFSGRKLQQMTEDLDACLRQLNDEQIWHRGGAHENAVGNLVLHLCGNMRQWMLHGVDGQADVRVRDAEFAAEGGPGGSELMGMFREVAGEARNVLARLPAERLLDTINPQNGKVSVLEAIGQVVGHVQLHVGQIILLTKQLLRKDLDLSIPRPR